MGPVSSKINNHMTRLIHHNYMKSEYVLHVRTGDRKGAGTDANVFILFIDDQGRKSSEIKLDLPLRNDLERGSLDMFPCPPFPQEFGEVEQLEIRRDDRWLASDWYAEYIILEHTPSSEKKYFPIHRWVNEYTRYRLSVYDVSLPQDDLNPTQRAEELEVKKQLYQYTCNWEGLPAQSLTFPSDEQFSDEYKWDLVRRKMKLLAESKFIRVVTKARWESLTDLQQMYVKFRTLGLPKGEKDWISDEAFARQRLNGCNPVTIRLCTELPERLQLKPGDIDSFLEGHTVAEAIEQKRLFYTDLKILETIRTKPEYTLCAPTALFYLPNDNLLVPIAIQLHQRQTEDNPVFFPNDPKYTWLLAKMWYNNADAQYHQAISHLGLTHLLMEGVVACTHRNLNASHPIFKLLAPHFLYLIAINMRGMQLLVAPGGWIDKTMTVGREGLFELIAKGMMEFRVNFHGVIPKELDARGLLDKNVLPGYYYRDDSLDIYNILYKYTKKITEHFYENDSKLEADHEIQSWVAEMASPRTCTDCKGLGLQGLPGEGRLQRIEDLTTICTWILFTCSVAHSAANMGQYDNYAFVPFYPALLSGEPPKSKEEKTEADILDTLPDQFTTLDIMVITKLLSSRGTNALGDFDVLYNYHPVAMEAKSELCRDLHELSKAIKERNSSLEHPYEWLDPESVPNSISI